MAEVCGELGFWFKSRWKRNSAVQRFNSQKVKYRRIASTEVTPNTKVSGNDLRDITAKSKSTGLTELLIFRKLWKVLPVQDTSPCWVTVHALRIWTERPEKNSTDLDQTPQNAASDQGLHCLLYKWILRLGDGGGSGSHFLAQVSNKHFLASLLVYLWQIKTCYC